MLLFTFHKALALFASLVQNGKWQHGIFSSSFLWVEILAAPFLIFGPRNWSEMIAIMSNLESSDAITIEKVL